jgi:site-specific recombinase XerD
MRGVPMATKINAQLESLINKVVGEHLIGGSQSIITLVTNYHRECKAGQHTIREDTYRSYPSFGRKLRTYALTIRKDDLLFDDVTVPMYHDFIRWMRSEGLGDHAVATNIKHLKKFMNRGFDLGFHTNESHRKKAFKSLKPPTQKKIYLTQTEINAFVEVDLVDHPLLLQEQDRFIVSYYFILRFKDSTTKIDRSKFLTQGAVYYFTNTSSKTGVSKFIPVKPLVKNILERLDYKLAAVSNQKANERVKMIAARAGLIDEVDGNPKWSLVTTHTARRSAATNLWLGGAPLPEIMQLGGWRTESQLRTYLVASGIELASVSATRDFFL